MTQPIRLILPDLFQDRLAKLTEHAAHVDMVIGAVAQHGLRVAPVTQWQATDLLVPYPSELMRAHRVSRRVNKPENDNPELLIVEA